MSGLPAVAPDMATLRVLIIAEDPLARAGLAMLLHDRPGLQVVGQLGWQEEGTQQLDVFAPDVVLLDSGWDGTHEWPQALAELAESGLPVLALLPDEEQAAQVRASGARGLLLRDAAAEQIVAALVALQQGLIVLDALLAESAPPLAEREIIEPLADNLTPREMQVLQLLAEGLANKTIALQLGISEHTVKYHVNSILTKLDAQSRTEAVVRATRLGLIVL